MNKFIILGCGYLGTNIANYIVKNENVSVYVLGIENEYNEYLNKNIVFIPKMIEQISEDDIELFKEAIVIDAVGNINATDDSKNSTTVFLNNCANKINLIQKLNTLKIKKYIFLSSGGTVYDDSDTPHKEDEKVNPKNIYALEKVIIEDYLKIFGLENSNFAYLILRLSNPYGGIVSKNKKQGIIDVAISKLIRNEQLEFYGKLDNVRDYIYIEDIGCYIYNLSINNIRNDIYNVGSGIGISINYIFDYLRKKTKKELKIEIIKSKTINIDTNTLDISKLKQVLNEKKTLSIEEGIDKVIMERWKNNE